jgi:GAF domain-containing protein
MPPFAVPAVPEPASPAPPPSAFATSLRPSPEPAPSQDVGGAFVAELSSLTGAFDLLFDFDRLCRRVLDLGIAEVHGVSGSLMLLDEEGRLLRIVAAVGLSDLVVQETRQRLGQGIAGRVAEEGEALLLVGTIGDERFPVHGERPEIPSAVCVPVVTEGRVLGVLNVNSDPTHEPFDQPDLRRLAALGRQVGSALDRSWQLRLVRGRSFEMSVRGAIESIASSAEDLVTRLRRVANRVTEVLHVDICAIWLHEPGTQRLVLRALGGATAASMDAISLPIGTGLAGWVARHRRPLVLRGAPDDPSDREVMQAASVAVPIRYQTELVGVLSIESHNETPMDDKRLALVATVAAVIGEQIGTSRAQASSERMVTMLSALAELGVAFSAAREKPNLGRLVAFTASTVLESDVATVRLARDVVPPGASGADLFELVAVHGATLAAEGDPLGELEERVARLVVERKGPITKFDLPSREASTLLTRCNVDALLGAPMLSDEGAVLGVVIVYRVSGGQERDHSYGEQEREIAARLGDYAASAAERFMPRGTRPHSPEVDG